MSARDRFEHLAAYEIWLTTGEWPSGPPTGFLAADDVTNALDELDEFDRLRVGGVAERAATNAASDPDRLEQLANHLEDEEPGTTNREIAAALCNAAERIRRTEAERVAERAVLDAAAAFAEVVTELEIVTDPDMRASLAYERRVEDAQIAADEIVAAVRAWRGAAPTVEETA